MADAWLVDEVFIGVPPNIYLSDEQVAPLIGGLDENYLYSVTYRHNENAAPTMANVYIDGVPHAMSDPTGGTGPYASGVAFTYSHGFVLGGLHHYYFEFSDGAETCRHPHDGDFTDPRNGHYHWDFEDAPVFTPVGPADDWQWGTPTSGPGGAYSGDKAWGTILDGDHSNNSQSRLVTPPLDFTFGASKLELRIMSWMETDTSTVCDGGNVKIMTSTDTTLLFPDTTQSWPYNAISFCPGNAWIPGEPGLYGWRPGEDLVFDLTPWIGETNAVIAFDFGSDGSTTAAGWYFDAVVIWCDVPLSVELMSFIGIPGDAQVTLRWETASEKDNQGFDIYRRAAGQDFERINVDRLPGAGSRATSHSYVYVDGDVINGTTYEYQLADVSLDGTVHRHEQIVSATPMAPAAARLPETFVLSQNFPNPFNPRTEIRYQIPEDGRVSLRIYNISGQEVACLVNDEREAGAYSIKWTDDEAAAGVYFCRLIWEEYERTIKMVMVK
jgi:hypothetical protein